MRHIAPLLALPTTLVFAACFNPRAGEMADGNDTDADDTSAGTSAGPSDGTATAPTTNDTTPTTADDDPTTTAGPGETEDAGCIEHDDCTDPGAPFCTAGTCVACDETPTPNDACSSRYPDSPLCDAGECVQCTAADTSSCDGNTPICDTDARTCTACTYHYQCPDSACDIAEGSCMPTDRVWTVGPTGTGDYHLFADALSQIPSGQKGTLVMLDGTHQVFSTITGGRTVAIIRGDGNPTFLAELSMSNATVYIQGIKMSGNVSPEAIYASGTRLWLDDCWFGEIIVGTSGFYAPQSRTAIRLRSGADLTMRNSIVGGFDEPNEYGVDIGGGSHANILYSTVGARASNLALTCSNPGTVTVRNSIIASQGNPAYSCATAELVSTAVRTSVSTANFADYTRGDLHLTAFGAGHFANIAAWQAGDPPFDIDGDARVSVDGAPEHAGADVP